jgi:hypothetical protein
MKKILLLLLLVIASFAATIPDAAKVGQFYAGCQAYSFRMYNVFEAIDKTAQCGGKTIEFYPGQKFDDTAKWDHNATPEMIDKVMKHLEAKGLTAVGYGVVKLGKDAARTARCSSSAKKSASASSSPSPTWPDSTASRPS